MWTWILLRKTKMFKLCVKSQSQREVEKCGWTLMVTWLDGQHAKMWRPVGERGEKGWAGTKVGCKIDLSFFPFIFCQMSSSEDLRRSQLNIAAAEVELQSDLWSDFLICGFSSAHLFCAKSLIQKDFDSHHTSRSFPVGWLSSAWNNRILLCSSFLQPLVTKHNRVSISSEQIGQYSIISIV